MHSINELADEPERTRVVENIANGCPGWCRLEVVVMYESGESAPHHLVSKTTRSIKCRDSAREFFDDAQVPRAPRHLIAEPAQARRDASHGSFVSPFGRCNVRLNAPCQVEAQLRNRPDIC
jgi:hypothetical protein